MCLECMATDAGSEVSTCLPALLLVQNLTGWEWAIYPGNWGAPLAKQNTTFYCFDENRECLADFCQLLVLEFTLGLSSLQQRPHAGPDSIAVELHTRAETTLSKCLENAASRALQTTFKLLDTLSLATGGGSLLPNTGLGYSVPTVCLPACGRQWHAASRLRPVPACAADLMRRPIKRRLPATTRGPRQAPSRVGAWPGKALPGMFIGVASTTPARCIACTACRPTVPHLDLPVAARAPLPHF